MRKQICTDWTFTERAHSAWRREEDVKNKLRTTSTKGLPGQIVSGENTTHPELHPKPKKEEEKS